MLFYTLQRTLVTCFYLLNLFKLQLFIRFTRTKFAANSKMVSIELEFINHAVNPIRDICIGDKVVYANIFIIKNYNRKIFKLYINRCFFSTS